MNKLYDIIAVLLIVGLFAVVTFLMVGCGGHKNQTPPTIATTVQEPLPPAAQVPDTKEPKAEIVALGDEVTAAKADSDKVIAVAQKSDCPAVKEALPILADENKHLAAAVARCQTSSAAIDRTQASIDDSTKATTAREQTMQKNTETLRVAATKNEVADDKQIAALQKENADLKNGEMAKDKSIMFWLGLGALLIGGVGFALGLECVQGFAMGLRLGPPVAAAGMVLIFISYYLATILWWMLWVSIGAFVLGVAPLIYHYALHLANVNAADVPTPTEPPVVLPPITVK